MQHSNSSKPATSFGRRVSETLSALPPRHATYKLNFSGSRDTFCTFTDEMVRASSARYSLAYGTAWLSMYYWDTSTTSVVAELRKSPVYSASHDFLRKKRCAFCSSTGYNVYGYMIWTSFVSSSVLQLCVQSRGSRTSAW